MQTAKAVVQDPAQNQSVETRALFDSGSQRSYITENLAKLLELAPIEEETLTLCTFGSKDIKKIPSNVVDLDVRTIDNKSIRMRVNTTPCITRDFTKSCLPPSVDRSRFESLQFADNYFSEEPNSSIQLLIGNDYYFKFILQDRRVVKDGLYLINTRLGWMFTGRVEIDTPRDAHLTECTLALGNWVRPGIVDLPLQIPVPLKRSMKRELERETDLNGDFETGRASTTICCGIVCETTWQKNLYPAFGAVNESDYLPLWRLVSRYSKPQLFE